MQPSTVSKTQPQSSLGYKPADSLLVLFKGDSGVGKSVAAFSFPNMYVFDFDRKMPSIAWKHFPEVDIQYNTFDDIFEVSQKLVEFEEYCPYETLFADSFTSLANLTIESIGQVKGETVPETLQRVIDTKNKHKQLEMMPIDYYGGEDRFCTHFVNSIKRLYARPGNPKYIIVSAHVLTVESAPDLKTKVITRSKSIVSKGRKVAAWLPTEFDNVWSFEIEQPLDTFAGDTKMRRVCYTEAYGEDSAKCSIDLPRTIDFTDSSFYSKIFDRVRL